ncbi:MAG TPA: hypothetical protein VJA87_01105 [Candidatus Paceibacterota bacterium]
MPQSKKVDDLIERARGIKMSPQAARAQRRSLVRGLAGDPSLTDEKIGEMRPELRD